MTWMSGGAKRHDAAEPYLEVHQQRLQVVASAGRLPVLA
jgi:hypothetical protein